MTNPRADAVRGGSDNVDAGQARRSDATATPSVPARLRRRRAASWRCEPLADGRRDPLDRCAEPLTDTELASWRLAWLHLHALGFPAVVPERVLAAAGSRVA
jgi:hypothetical protein